MSSWRKQSVWLAGWERRRIDGARRLSALSEIFGGKSREQTRGMLRPGPGTPLSIFHPFPRRTHRRGRRPCAGRTHDSNPRGKYAAACVLVTTTLVARCVYSRWERCTACDRQRVYRVVEPLFPGCSNRSGPLDVAFELCVLFPPNELL